MVKITDKTTEDFIYFPKNVYQSGNTHTMKIYSNSTLETLELSLVDYDNMTDFYKFMYDWSDIKDGEYEYTIDDKEKGLLIVGENLDTVRKTNTNEYNNINTYKQYEG